MARTLASAPQVLAAGSVTLALLSASIAIPTSYLADGALFLRADGTVAATQPISMGGNRLTGVGTPSGANDAVNKAYADSLFNSAPYLGGADTVATANVSSRSGLGTYNGHTLVAGDVIHLPVQTIATENGPWIAASGAWTRPAYYAAGAVLREGSTIIIERGTFAGYQYVLATQGGATVDTTATTWLGIPAPTAYTAGSGISITGTTLAVKVGSGLNFDGSSNVQVLADGTSLTVSGTGVKVSNGTAAGQVLLSGTGNAATWTALSGDVAGVTAAGVVTLAGTVVKSTTFVAEEVPGGAVDGGNTTFTLANAPIAGSVALYVGGARQKAGAGNDYTISGQTITMTYAPASGVNIVADYRK